MDQRLLMFLDELYADGVGHDAVQPDRLLKRRNLEPHTAGLLSLIVRIAGARTVVEIGTSNGYSTIWLADAVGDTGGAVVSVDTASLEDARTTSGPPTQSNLASRRALNSARKMAARIWRGLPMRASICSSSTP